MQVLETEGSAGVLGALAWCWLSEAGERAAWVLGPIVGTQATLPPPP